MREERGEIQQSRRVEFACRFAVRSSRQLLQLLRLNPAALSFGCFDAQPVRCDDQDDQFVASRKGFQRCCGLKRRGFSVPPLFFTTRRSSERRRSFTCCSSCFSALSAELSRVFSSSFCRT